MKHSYSFNTRVVQIPFQLQKHKVCMYSTSNIPRDILLKKFVNTSNILSIFPYKRQRCCQKFYLAMSQINCNPIHINILLNIPEKVKDVFQIRQLPWTKYLERVAFNGEILLPH